MYHLSPISPSPPTSFLNIQHHLLRDNASAATAVALKVSVLLLLQSTIVCSVPHSPPCLIVKYSLAMDTLHLYLLCFPSNISDNETLLESRPTDWLPDWLPPDYLTDWPLPDWFPNVQHLGACHIQSVRMVVLGSGNRDHGLIRRPFPSMILKSSSMSVRLSPPPPPSLYVPLFPNTLLTNRREFLTDKPHLTSLPRFRLGPPVLSGHPGGNPNTSTSPGP